jgi:hypothetical protein
MASRSYNPKRAKTHFTYTISEAADLYSVHRQTVRHWLANGLMPLDERRPVLIHGGELNRFHEARRATSKRTCGPGELYCLGCKQPRKPAGSMVDFLPGRGSLGVVVGICPACDGMMRQNVNTQRLDTFRAVLEVTTRPHPEPIEECPETRWNYHLQEGSAG